MEAKPAGISGSQPYPERHNQPSVATDQQPVSAGDTVTLQIPVTVSKKDMTPDPATGLRPIDNFEFGYIPKNAVITSKEAIQQVVDDARNTPPAGKILEFDESRGGKAITVTKGLMGYAASLLTPVATSLIMAGTAPLWAAPAAIIGGTIGIIAGLDGIKKAFDTKAYYMNKKDQGVESEDIRFRNDDGEMTTQRIMVNDMTRNSRDAIIGGGLHVLGSALTVAAGLCGGPALAIGATVMMLGGALLGGRHAIASGAGKVGSYFKRMFTGSHSADHKPEKSTTGQQAVQAAIPAPPGLTSSSPAAR